MLGIELTEKGTWESREEKIRVFTQKVNCVDPWKTVQKIWRMLFVINTSRAFTKIKLKSNWTNDYWIVQMWHNNNGWTNMAFLLCVLNIFFCNIYEMIMAVNVCLKVPIFFFTTYLFWGKKWLKTNNKRENVFQMCSRRFLKTLENDEKIHLCAWNPLGCRQLSLFIILLMCFIFFTVVEFVYRLLVSGVHMFFFISLIWFL